MIIVLKVDITVEQRQALEKFLQSHKLRIHAVVGTRQSVLAAVGKPSIGAEELASLPGVEEVVPISTPYKCASRELQKTDSIFRLNWQGKGVGRQPIPIGAQHLLLCAELPTPDKWWAEVQTLSEEDWGILQHCYRQAILALRGSGISMLRYSPLGIGNLTATSSSPAHLAKFVYDPEGLAEFNAQQLQFMAKLKQDCELPLLVQLSTLHSVEKLAQSADVLQLAAQQMRNTELLAELVRTGKPLVLQRAADASLEEFLMTAEFVLARGQKELILAETFMPNAAYANGEQSQMLGLANIQLLQELSHLPVFVNLVGTDRWLPSSHSVLNFSQVFPTATGANANSVFAITGQSPQGQSQLSSLTLASLGAGAQGLEFALNSAAIVQLFHSGAGDFGDLDSVKLHNGKVLSRKLQAEWFEALHMLEQLGEMAKLLQKEIVCLPQIDTGKANSYCNSGSACNENGQELLVAFQGELGAYSEQALQQFFNSDNAGLLLGKQQFRTVQSLPCQSFRQMFEAVQNGHVSFAVVPMENSLAGSIMESYDLLLEYPDLCICAETQLRVSHMLIAAKDSKLEQIEKVRSHPQALAQSSKFLEKHGMQPMANFDTAASVRELKENPESRTAAIASALAAEIYDMQILGRAIESNPHNYTRFAIVRRSDCPLSEPAGQMSRAANKWSICLRLRNFSGSLATALEIFHKYSLDLSKLESRPIMGQPWSYRFYLDALISEELSAEKEAQFFCELERISEEYRVIGRYRQHLK